MALTKALVIFILVVLSTSSYGQVIMNRDSLLRPLNANYSIDSFTFCNKTFKIPKDCDGTPLKNCCIAYPDISLMCGSKNGDFMNWYYLPTLDLARQIFEGYMTTWENNNWKISKRQVNWYLLGFKTTSWYIEAESNAAVKCYVVLSYGAVNGKFVITEYYAHARITQKYILPVVFKEIIRWD